MLRSAFLRVFNHPKLVPTPVISVFLNHTMYLPRYPLMAIEYRSSTFSQVYMVIFHCYVKVYQRV